MVRLRMLRSQRRFISLDIGALDWYTRRDRACDKPLILLISLALRGNPSLSASQTRRAKNPIKLVISQATGFGWWRTAVETLAGPRPRQIAIIVRPAEAQIPEAAR